MKRQFKILLILITLVFNVGAQALAGDSIGLSVSCTIPAIPGVNAPLNEAANTEPTAVLEEKEAQTFSPVTEAEEEPVFIEVIQEIQLAKETTPVLTKIIYSR